MPGFPLLRPRPSTEPTVWMVLNALMVGCIGVTFLVNLHVWGNEARRANDTGQRAVIDAITGTVALGSPLAKTKPAFEVASPKEPAPEKPAPEHAAETTADAPPQQVAPEPVVDTHGLPTLRTQPLASTLPEIENNQKSLVPAPAPEVSETIHGVALPKRNGSVTPATLYAQRFVRTPDQHLLTFVVLDTGLSAQSLPLIMGLPKTTTLAFSPYSADVTGRIAKLRRAGFEVWGMLPSMNARYPQDDPGPLGLVASLPKDELMRRLHTIMADTIGSVGLVLPPDETLSSRTAAFSPILAEIDGRGLSILSTHPTHSAKQVSGSQQMKSLVERADVLLDPVPDAEQIEKKLADLALTLKTSDSVIVAMTARPQTLLLVQKWLAEHPLEEPVTLAPLSAHWLPKEAAPEPEVEESSGGHGAPKAEKKPEAKPAPKKDAKPSGHH